MKKKQDSSTFFLDHVTKPSPSTNQNYTGVGRGGGSSQTKNPLQEIRKKKAIFIQNKCKKTENTCKNFPANKKFFSQKTTNLTKTGRAKTSS